MASIYLYYCRRGREEVQPRKHRPIGASLQQYGKLEKEAIVPDVQEFAHVSR